MSAATRAKVLLVDDQVENLIAHERDKGGYHYSGTREEKRCELVSQRFTGPCGEDPQHVLAVKQAFEHLELAGTEFFIVEILFERLMQSIAIKLGHCLICP